MGIARLGIYICALPNANYEECIVEPLEALELYSKH